MKNTLTFKLAIAGLLLLTAGIAQAQSPHSISIGFGANFSDIAVTIDGESSEDNPFSSRSGLQFDFAYRYRKNAFALDVFLGYSQQGAEQKVSEFATNGTFSERVEGTARVRYNYVYLSPVFGVNLEALSGSQPGKFHARLGLGPWIGIGVGGTSKIDLTITETGPGFTSVTRIQDSGEIEVGSDNPGQMNGLIFGAQLALRLELDLSDRVSIYIDPRYLFGLSDITPDGSSSGPNVNLLHRTATVTGGVGIRL